MILRLSILVPVLSACVSAPSLEVAPEPSDIPLDGPFTVRQGMPLAELVVAVSEHLEAEIAVAPGLESELEGTPAAEFGPKRVPRADLFEFLRVALFIQDFVCDTTSTPWQVRRTTPEERSYVTTCPIYVLPEELDDYADWDVHLSTVLEAPDPVVRDLLAGLDYSGTEIICLPVCERSLIVQGPAAAVAALGEYVRSCAAANPPRATHFEVPERGMSLLELVVAARELLEAQIVVAPGLEVRLEETPVLPFGPERVPAEGLEQFVQIQLFVNDLVWDRTDSPSVVRRATKDEIKGCCTKEYRLPEGLDDTSRRR